MERIDTPDHDCNCDGPVDSAIYLPGDQKTTRNRIMHFLVRWLAFFGIFAGTTVCPFCGQPGCPVGAGGVAFAGGFFALLTQNWKAVLSTVKNKIIPPPPLRPDPDMRETAGGKNCPIAGRYHGSDHPWSSDSGDGPVR